MTKKKRLSFANAVIVVCVTVCAAITAAVIWEYHRLDTVVPSGVVTALLGLWGGELLIIALRQIFGSDAVGRGRGPAQGGDGESI